MTDAAILPVPTRHRSAVAWFAETRAALLIIWALYLVPRLLVLLIPVEPTSDATWYYGKAADLANGLGYLNEGVPTAFWPPGMSMALSVAFRIFGISVTSVGIFNLLLGIPAAWLTLSLGRYIFRSEGAGRAALLLLAIYPNSIGYFPLALTEVFYTTLLLAICWLLVVPRGWLAYLCAGLLLGLASLVKAQTLVVVPLIVAIALLRETGFWRRVPLAALRAVGLIALAAVVIAPWTIRNERYLGSYVVVSTNGGFTLFTGNHDTADGGYQPNDPAVIAIQNAPLDEVARDAAHKQAGIDWIRAHPGGFVRLMPLKLFKLWATDGEAIWAYETGMAGYARYAALFWTVRIANQVYYMALLLGFAVAAMVTLRRRWRAGERLVDWWLLPYGIAAYPTAIAIVFSGQSRFHYPVMPFICMACGWLMIDLLTRRREGMPTPG